MANANITVKDALKQLTALAHEPTRAHNTKYGAGDYPAVQWTMNSTLAEIGIHFPKLRKRAISIGETLGIYRDYPVSKGCTSPFAPIWIDAMVRRQG